MLRFLTAGESHGKGLVVIVEGLPAGLAVDGGRHLQRAGQKAPRLGRGPRMRFEADELTLLGGIRHGRTLGSPVAIEVGNSEWPKWDEEMSPAPGQTAKPLTQPRPGHADLAGMQKYALLRPVTFWSGPAPGDGGQSRRRVRSASCSCTELGIDIVSHVVQMGPVVVQGRAPAAAERPGSGRRFPGALLRPRGGSRDGRSHEGGGQGRRLPGGSGRGDRLRRAPGLGSHVHWDRKIDGLLAQALMSIHAIKAVEIGDGIEVAGLRGSGPTTPSDGTQPARPTRGPPTTPAVSKAASPTVSRSWPVCDMKPLSTLNRPVLKTVDVVTKEETVSFKERTDHTAVPAMGVVAETMMAWVLAVGGPPQVWWRLHGRGRRNKDAYLANLRH